MERFLGVLPLNVGVNILVAINVVSLELGL